MHNNALLGGQNASRSASCPSASTQVWDRLLLRCPTSLGGVQPNTPEQSLSENKSQPSISTAGLTATIPICMKLTKIIINRQRARGDENFYKLALQEGFLHIHEAAPRESRAMSTDPTALQLQSLRLEKLRKAPTSHPAEQTEPCVCSSGQSASAQGSPAGLVALRSWIQDEGLTAPLCGPAQLSVGPLRLWTNAFTPGGSSRKQHQQSEKEPTARITHKSTHQQNATPVTEQTSAVTGQVLHNYHVS